MKEVPGTTSWYICITCYPVWANRSARGTGSKGREEQQINQLPDEQAGIGNLEKEKARSQAAFIWELLELPAARVPDCGSAPRA
jgi:hypothetical protein